jgi:hypothetical protein
VADRSTVSGIHGFVSAGDFTDHASTWSIDIECDTPEDTNWTDWETWPATENWRTYLPGLRGWSGSFEGFHDDSPTSSLLPGSEMTGLFYVKWDPDDGTYVGYSGLIIITGVHPEVSLDGIASLSVDFQGTEEITIGDIGGATTS